MPSRGSSGLVKQINSLLTSRATHAAAIEDIDKALSAIKLAIGGDGQHRGPASGAARRGPKPGSKRRRKRGSFAMSGDESILAFVKSAGNPTTKDVNKHWKGEGRGGAADNALTKLVKLKRLKRTQVNGERGSRYQLAK